MFVQLIEKLDQSGLAYTIHKHEPIRTVQDAQEKWALGIANLVKTVAFKRKTGGVVLTAVRAVDRLDYKKLANYLGISRRAISPLSPEEVDGLLGVPPGGVCPIPLVDGVEILFDQQVVELPLIYCGACRLDRTLEMGAADLQTVAQAVAVDLVKG